MWDIVILVSCGYELTSPHFYYYNVHIVHLSFCQRYSVPRSRVTVLNITFEFWESISTYSVMCIIQFLFFQLMVSGILWSPGKSLLFYPILILCNDQIDNNLNDYLALFNCLDTLVYTVTELMIWNVYRVFQITGVGSTFPGAMLLLHW